MARDAPRAARPGVPPSGGAASPGSAPSGTHRTAARGLFDPRELRKLVALMEESGLLELEIESAGDKVRLVRALEDGRVEPAAPAGRPPAEGASSLTNEQAITSPMVGTFHRAPAPGQTAFVEVGDVVERGQVLCLIEAMKMMNEIEAECHGRVKQVLIENGRTVEYGEALFLIEPL